MPDSDLISDAQLVFDFEDADFDRAWEQAVAVERIHRGIGFCLNHRCESYLKTTFLLYHEGPFRCRTCSEVGAIEAERGHLNGSPGTVVGEVRIEYCFDPASRLYRELAVVRDEALGPNVSSYTAFCPLMSTERRALKAAETLLISLNEGVLNLEGGSHELPPVREHVLRLDDSAADFSAGLRLLELSWRDNPFYSEGTVVSQSSEYQLHEGETSGPQSSSPDRKAHQGPGVSRAGTPG